MARSVSILFQNHPQRCEIKSSLNHKHNRISSNCYITHQNRTTIFVSHRILRVQCKDLKLNGEFDFKNLASQTPGFVGADLTALVREAAMCAVTR